MLVLYDVSDIMFIIFFLRVYFFIQLIKLIKFITLVNRCTLHPTTIIHENYSNNFSDRLFERQMRDYLYGTFARNKI